MFAAGLMQAGPPALAPPALARAAWRWHFANCCFDEASLTLTVAGVAVETERRPLALLALLLSHAGEVVTKDEIIDAIWPGREVTEASLTKCMARLRLALNDGEHAIVKTVHGYGYRFAAPVRVEEAVPAAPEPAAAAFGPGDLVPTRPNWRLVRHLGGGGYGDAWLAEQTKSAERRVIKFARDAAGLAALRREITLGRLLREGLGRRPDLVRILDWQLEEPPAFIEIAWAELGSLADWAASQGGAASIPLETRLDLAAQVADALSAIHGMAVLHKDLKPANVLIRLDEAGAPAIILTDFGSGHALDPARLDAFGITRMEPAGGDADTTAGTQMYQAPEIAAGGAPTVQADIFALGVMLFQLAAGEFRQPLAPGWEEKIADPLLREDIAAAAAGDPARRLNDAADLARRLRTLPARHAARVAARAAADEAVATKRALELARARRMPLLAMLVVLLVGLSATTLLYVRAERANGRARMEAARAQAVTRFLTEDLFSAANPTLGADPNIPVRKLLDAASADLDHRFPAGGLDRAAIESAIGSAYAGLADGDHAKPLLASALSTLRARLGEDDPQTQSVRLAMAELAEHLQDDVAMRAAAAGILAAHPRNAETAYLARFYAQLAECGAHGNNTDCARRMQALFAEARAKLGPSHVITLKIESELAFRLGDSEHPAEAIPLARETVALTRLVYGPDHLLLQERRFHLAEVLIEAGQADEAVGILTDVRARVLAMAGGETALSARAVNQLGFAYSVLKKYPESLAAFQTALDYNMAKRGEMDDLSREAMNNIANVQLFLGHTKAAIAMGLKVLDVQRRAAGPNQGDTIWFENNVANFYHLDGNLVQSEATYRDVVARARLVFTHGEWDLGSFLFHLGEVLGQEGKVDEARGLLTESVAILSAGLGEGNPRTLKARAVLAGLK